MCYAFVYDGHYSYNSYMREIAAKEAKNRFGQLIDAAQRAPVCVTKQGRAVGIMMSVDQYERLRGAAWERVSQTLDRIGKQAAEAGLTDVELDSLLADES